MISKQGETGNARNPSKWVFLLESRKFWAAVVGLALVVFRGFYPDFPVSDELITKALLVVIAYIVSTALEDAGVGRWLKP